MENSFVDWLFWKEPRGLSKKGPALICMFEIKTRIDFNGCSRSLQTNERGQTTLERRGSTWFEWYQMISLNNNNRTYPKDRTTYIFTTLGTSIFFWSTRWVIFKIRGVFVGWRQRDCSSMDERKNQFFLNISSIWLQFFSFFYIYSSIAFYHKYQPVRINHICLKYIM